MEVATACSCCWPQQGTMTKVAAQRRGVVFMVLYNMKGVCGVVFLSNTHTNIWDTKHHFCGLRICGSLVPKWTDCLQITDLQIRIFATHINGNLGHHLALQYAYCITICILPEKHVGRMQRLSSPIVTHGLAGL